MFVFSLVLIAVLIFADQLIKIIVDSCIDIGGVVEVIKFGNFKLFSLEHVRNSGAAWSIMQGKTWFLVGVPLIVCGFGVYYMYRQKDKSRFQLVSLAMLVAGGIGNLIDRVRLHEVIDYIKFEPVKFPVFNFADICVVVGALMFAVYIIFLDKPDKKSVAEEEKSEPVSEETTENSDE
ncbi:MAG: signal peptidase II [Ruminococcus sp.]|jgi:signal peptidase II|nr:signal peptidase II [Ruminococcus sp.]